MPVKILIYIYIYILVRPHFDYCDIIFHIPHGAFDGHAVNVSLNNLRAKIESVQYQAAPAITGTWQGISRIKLYDKLGRETLSFVSFKALK